MRRTNSETTMRLLCRLISLFLLTLSISAFAETTQATPSSTVVSQANSTRQSLVGAWRLKRIERLGANGPIVEPFYQSDSDGLIVYDASGWMSVQILGRHRPSIETPAQRTGSPTEQTNQPIKAALLDSYYAYFGTWQVDEATRTVTHQISGALYPDETGMRYAQQVSFEDDCMIFSISDQKNGQVIVRRKVWQRVTPVLP